MKKKKESKSNSLDQIKRLLVLGLIHNGIKAKDIAATLGVDPAIITRMVPARQIKKK